MKRTRRREFDILLQRYYKLILDEKKKLKSLRQGFSERKPPQSLLRRLEMEIIWGGGEVIKLYADFLEFFSYSKKEIEHRIKASVPYSC